MGIRASYSCDYIGVQFSTAVVSLVSTAALIGGFTVFLAWSPARAVLSAALRGALPVIISATLLIFVKMFWVDGALTDQGHIVHRRAFALWDFVMVRGVCVRACSTELI